MSSPSALKRTPLFEVHRRSGARLIDFGGWEMPVQYSGIIDEHNAVRRSVGVFDVSHMGEIDIRGPEALQLTNWVTTNAADRLKIGQVHYSGLLYGHGGFVDDILVHKVADDHYFLCVNASNQDKDFEHIRSQNRWNAEVEFSSPKYAQIAVQGPKAIPTVQKLTKTDFAGIKNYWFTDGEVCGIPARIARTGYTGEDGCELYVAPEQAVRIWDEVMRAGEEFGIKPCGLGARNTLRLEAKMALYGHEIGPSITPLEADLGWIVKMDKGDFLGREALAKQAAEGIKRKVVGFEMQGRGIGRDGYEVFIDGIATGFVTSGGPSPTLNKNIGLCYLPSERAVPGQKIQIQIRGQFADAVTVPTPFYKRAK